MHVMVVKIWRSVEFGIFSLDMMVLAPTNSLPERSSCSTTWNFTPSGRLLPRSGRGIAMGADEGLCIL
jgi:hypothetical protein